MCSGSFLKMGVDSLNEDGFGLSVADEELELLKRTSLGNMQVAYLNVRVAK